MKTKIQAIYNNSKQNYGAPKSTKEFLKDGKTISERTVGKYMKEMGIQMQWVILGQLPQRIRISATIFKMF